MIKTVSRISIFTLLIFGCFLSGSAFASVCAMGSFTYYSETDTLTIDNVRVIESDIDLLNFGNIISLEVSLTSNSTVEPGSTISFNGSTVIEATQREITYSTVNNNLYTKYTTENGAWMQSLPAFYLDIYLSVGESLDIFDTNDTTVYTGSVTVYITQAVVPIPSSLTLIGLGLVMLTGYRRKY